MVYIVKMHQVNLAGIDLNLLPCLEALLRRRNVTLAAADVGLSQPAMSRALGRLRDQLRDPLLLRVGGGLVLTARAQALLPQLNASLGTVRALFQQPELDLAGIRRTVRIAASDIQSILLAPGIMSRLGQAAPGVDVRFEPYRPDLHARMQDGSLDLAFAMTTTPLPPGAASTFIGGDRLALVMRRGHPLAERELVAADYASVDHVSIALTGDGQSDMDAALAALGVARRIAFVTPYFTSALAVVAATDLVTTISAAFARQFQSRFDLVLRQPPLPRLEILSVLVWSAIRSGDPFLTWFRDLVRAVAAQTFETAEPELP
jgi:DNA-binding transcriptional LysR family regulator